VTNRDQAKIRLNHTLVSEDYEERRNKSSPVYDTLNFFLSSPYHHFSNISTREGHLFASEASDKVIVQEISRK